MKCLSYWLKSYTYIKFSTYIVSNQPGLEGDVHGLSSRLKFKISFETEAQ